MNYDPRQELAVIKASLARSEDTPITSGVAVLSRYPYAAAVMALGVGLLLIRRPSAARAVLMLAGWGVRHLWRRALPNAV